MKSMFVSVISLIVAFVALFYVVCVGVETDHAATLIAVLGTLVTALMGWNIVQYMFAKNEVRCIAKEESDKAAGEAAERVQSDLKHITDAIDCLISARINAVYNVSVRSIAYYLDSLQHYNLIKDSSLHQEYTSDLLEELSHHVQTWKTDGCLYKDSEWIDSAVSLLDTFDTPLSKGIKEALLDAPEWNPNEKHYFSSITPL